MRSEEERGQRRGFMRTKEVGHKASTRLVLQRRVLEACADIHGSIRGVLSLRRMCNALVPGSGFFGIIPAEWVSLSSLRIGCGLSIQSRPPFWKRESAASACATPSPTRSKYLRPKLKVHVTRILLFTPKHETNVRVSPSSV